MHEKIFTNLEGNWFFERYISGEGTSKGTASFKKTNQDTLFYREDALFTNLNGFSLKNFREYYYRLVDGAISVFFLDGKLLHNLTFDGRVAKGHHLCNCDTYDAEYFFENPGRFTLTYTVKGPKKDFYIRSSFTKSGS